RQCYLGLCGEGRERREWNGAAFRRKYSQRQREAIRLEWRTERRTWHGRQSAAACDTETGHDVVKDICHVKEGARLVHRHSMGHHPTWVGEWRTSNRREAAAGSNIQRRDRSEGEVANEGMQVIRTQHHVVGVIAAAWEGKQKR